MTEAQSAEIIKLLNDIADILVDIGMLLFIATLAAIWGPVPGRKEPKSQIKKGLDIGL